jgi:hypothetical protein
MQIERSPRKANRKPAARRHVAVVHSLAEARAALVAGRAACLPVVLVSPPDAAAYLGVGYFWALVEAARAEFSQTRIEAVMDCGEAPGFALSALRMGFRTVVLRGDPRARARVAAIARALGARLLLRPPPGSPR